MVNFNVYRINWQYHSAEKQALNKVGTTWIPTNSLLKSCYYMLNSYQPRRMCWWNRSDKQYCCTLEMEIAREGSSAFTEPTGVGLWEHARAYTGELLPGQEQKERCRGIKCLQKYTSVQFIMSVMKRGLLKKKISVVTCSSNSPISSWF